MNKCPRLDKEIVVSVKNVGRGAVDTENTLRYITNINCIVGDVLRYKVFKGWKKHRKNKNVTVEVVSVRELRDEDTMARVEFVEIVNIDRQGRNSKTGRKIKRGKNRQKKNAHLLITDEKIEEVTLTKDQNKLLDTYRNKIEELCKGFLEDMESLDKDIERYNAMQEELLHDVETAKYSASDGSNFAQELQEVRQSRRLKKDLRVDRGMLIKSIQRATATNIEEIEKNLKKSLVIRNDWQENFKIKNLNDAI